MKMHSYEIRYRHKEGDGIFAVSTGRPSGEYTHTMHGHADEREAVETWEASHRHGDTLLSVKEVA